MTEQEKREKVISRLEKAVEVFDGRIFGPMYDMWMDATKDTLALLKAQEPIEPKIWEGERIIPDSIHAGYSYPVTDVFYDCGKCGVNLWRGQPNQFIQFCKHCGRAVKWE